MPNTIPISTDEAKSTTLHKIADELPLFRLPLYFACLIAAETGDPAPLVSFLSLADLPLYHKARAYLILAAVVDEDPVAMHHSLGQAKKALETALKVYVNDPRDRPCLEGIGELIGEEYERL